MKDRREQTMKAILDETHDPQDQICKKTYKPGIESNYEIDFRVHYS